MRTNRDLYRFVSEVLVAFADNRRSLEEYLRALLALGSPHSEEMGIPLEAFASMLIEGFTAEPSSIDPGWDHADLRFDGADPGYIGWERVLVSQVLDLRAMALDDTLANELRYFGVEAKRPPRREAIDRDTLGQLRSADLHRVRDRRRVQRLGTG